MTKNNKMAKVAEMLGVKLGEEFKFQDPDSGEVYRDFFKFTADGLEVYAQEYDMWCLAFGDEITQVLRGDLAIKRFSKSKHAEYHEDYLLPLGAE